MNGSAESSPNSNFDASRCLANNVSGAPLMAVNQTEPKTQESVTTLIALRSAGPESSSTRRGSSGRSRGSGPLTWCTGGEMASA
jgi:hypothetical protein